MSFLSEPQEVCYRKIVPWLKESFGQFARPVEDQPVVLVNLGTTAAQVTVLPWGDDDAVITTRAWVTHGTEITPDLMRYLLHENNRMRFGAFVLDDEDDIFFEHTIVGSTCDEGELRSSVTAVVTTADKYDDEIVNKYGGQCALDRMKDVAAGLR
jgi:hypothetical protein